MNESIPQHSPYLYWLPKITHYLYDNIDKIMRDTIDRDPLLFIPRPTWQVYSKENGDDFMLINISDIHQINIYLVYKYYAIKRAKISHIDISENWYEHHQSYSRRVATVKPCNYTVTWIDNVYTKNYPTETIESNDRVANALIKLKLVKWIK